MCHKSNVKKALLVFFILSIVYLNQPAQAHASGVLVLDGGHRHERYAEVVVGGGRYYYNEGIFYTGDPGHYVVVEAPVGAIVYSVPPSYERVEIDGVLYFRYQDVYYRPAGHGYEVVRIERSRDQGHNNSRGGEGRGERRDEHYGR